MTKILATIFLLATLLFAGVYTYALVGETLLAFRFVGAIGLCLCLVCFILCIVIIQDGNNDSN